MFNKFINSFITSNDEERYQYTDFICNNADKLFESDYLELAHVSIIWKLNQDEVKCYLNAPNFWKKRGFKTIYNGLNINVNDWYRLKLNENSFYPIGVGDGFSFLSSILGNTHLLNSQDEIVLKINIIKRVGGWRNVEIEKYKHFLNGNMLAVENGLVRKLMEYLQSNHDEPKHNVYSYLEEIENKIKDEQYKFECLIGISSKSNKCHRAILSTISHSVDGLSGLNSFEIEKATDIDDTFYYNQFLSKTELKSLMDVSDLINTTDKIIDPVAEIADEIEDGGEKCIYDLLPLSKDKKTDDEEYKDIAEQIKRTLKRVEVIKNEKDLKLDSKINGLSFVRCQYEIPKELVYTKIFNKKEDIKVALGVSSLTIEQGNKPDTIAFLIAKEKRSPVYLGNVFSDNHNRKQLDKLDIPFFVGIDPLGKAIFRCLRELTHLLIAGETGGGKSVFINQAILTMIMSMSPKELKLYLIDPKLVEFAQFKNFPHVGGDVITDPDKASQLLDKLTSLEMEERYELFVRSGVKDIKGYNEKFPKKPIPYIVVVVDEFADLRITNGEVIDYIKRLSQKARAAGIHLMIATQQPNAKVIDKLITNNLPSKISFRLENSSSYKTVFGTGIPFQLLGKGHGGMKLKGQLREFEQFQSAAVSLDSEEEESTYKRIISYINKNGYSTKVDEIQEVDQLSKLKSIIANTGETRARQLRSEMKTRPEVIKELMQRLVDEGWLNKLEGNKGYEIIADEEELKKWRM